MTLGVYDGDFKFAHALSIVRRYLDRHATYNKERTAIIYRTHNGRRVWKQANYADGTPIKTHKGAHVFSPQFEKDVCFLSREAAYAMVNDLSQE